MIELYAADTANGRKALLMLEEMKIDYHLHKLDLVAGDQFDPEFMKLSPVGKMPVITTDCNGESRSIYGSEAIAIFLAETQKVGLPAAYPERAHVLEMASFVSSDLAMPLATQFQIEYIVEGDHPAAIDYFIGQARRMFEVLEGAVSKRGFIATDTYSIADMLALPHVAISANRIPGLLDGLDALIEWRDRLLTRSAVQRAFSTELF